MPTMHKLLIVEDELTNAILLKRILSKANYSVVVANNGQEAMDHLGREKFDAVLTDWMMPRMDGIELIRQMREKMEQLPYIIMITALVSEGARSYALESGADDYIAKPIDVQELLTRLQDGLAKIYQDAPKQADTTVTRDTNAIPPFVGVVIGTSTGGPPTLIELFKGVEANTNAAFFIVQHGPAWMLETFSQRLQKETSLQVRLATHNQEAEKGHIYIAPGDKHLRIEAETFRMTLDDGPKENFVRPAADSLFRSAATAFGKYTVGVVLTGLGRDGAQGASQIASVKGTIVVQDPATAVAPSMPTTVVESGIPHRLVPLDQLGKAVSETIFPISAALKKVRAGK